MPNTTDGYSCDSCEFNTNDFNEMVKHARTTKHMLTKHSTKLPFGNCSDCNNQIYEDEISYFFDTEGIVCKECKVLIRFFAHKPECSKSEVFS